MNLALDAARNAELVHELAHDQRDLESLRREAWTDEIVASSRRSGRGAEAEATRRRLRMSPYWIPCTRALSKHGRSAGLMR